MSMMRGEPFEGLRTLRRSLERLFDDIGTDRPFRLLRELPLEGWEPAVEVFEADGEVVVRAELPNVDPKNVEIAVTGDAVTLKGETKHEEEKKERNYYHRELRYGAFLRVLPLPTEVKGPDAKATYKDGVLEVRIPKSERVKPVTVKIQAA